MCLTTPPRLFQAGSCWTAVWVCIQSAALVLVDHSLSKISSDLSSSLNLYPPWPIVDMEPKVGQHVAHLPFLGYSISQQVPAFQQLPIPHIFFAFFHFSLLRDVTTPRTRGEMNLTWYSYVLCCYRPSSASLRTNGAHLQTRAPSFKVFLLRVGRIRACLVKRP